MSNPASQFIPVPLPDEADIDAPTKEVDGEKVLDPDANPDRISSVEADRLASGADDD